MPKILYEKCVHKILMKLTQGCAKFRVSVSIKKSSYEKSCDKVPKYQTIKNIIKLEMQLKMKKKIRMKQL